MIRILSDLHLEFFKGSLEVFTQFPKADYLVLAGDICTPSTVNRAKELLTLLEPLYTKIFYVLGNHEYYGPRTDYSVLASEKTILLENSGYRDAHISVWGSTLWTNVDTRGFLALSDSRHINLSDYRQRHSDAVRAIEAIEPVDVIVTHHVPLRKLTDPRYAHYPDYIQSGFSSTDCDHLTGKARVWVYGHTHAFSDRVVGGTRFVCNPLGYPGENLLRDLVVTL